MLSSHLSFTETPLFLWFTAMQYISTISTPKQGQTLTKAAGVCCTYYVSHLLCHVSTKVVRSNSKTSNLGITFVKMTTFWTSALLEYL